VRKERGHGNEASDVTGRENRVYEQVLMWAIDIEAS
jgi:hypothetical protein